MITIKRSRQLDTDLIFTVRECWSDSWGAYQVAEGYDKEGNELYLNNAGDQAARNFWVSSCHAHVLFEHTTFAKLAKLADTRREARNAAEKAHGIVRAIRKREDVTDAEFEAAVNNWDVLADVRNDAIRAYDEALRNARG